MYLVIPFSQSQEIENELRYALRSWDIFYKDSITPIILTNENIEYIKKENQLICSPESKKENGFKNVLTKIKHFCNSHLCKDDFLYSYDDIILTNPVGLSDIFTPRARHNLVNEDIDILCSDAGLSWREKLKNARDYLIRNNYTAYNYETHSPRLYNVKMLKNILPLCGDKHIATMFFNTYYGNHSTTIDEIKISCKNDTTKKDIEDEIQQGKLWMNFRNSTYTKEVRRYLKEQFKEKSKWEK